MIPELGQFAVVLALLLAIVQGTLPIIGASSDNLLWKNLASYTAILKFFLIGIAFFSLMKSYVVSDFTVINVINNSHSDKPLLYKIAGTWGNHEGSILLWILILVTFGATLAIFGRGIPSSLKARTLGVQAWISIGFISFLLWTSNPFERTFPPPLNGNDLNPLLQDIGLAIHPPLLYIGYVGFSIVYSFSVAALIGGSLDANWARLVRPWILVAWSSLTAGIALGSWWAYYELGWGGWWFWDPVENVSLMPWLVGTALLHSAIVTEKRDTFKSWTLLLAILTFSLSLLGTFIVRSGLLTSVHSFAVDPERGVYILILLALSIGGSLSLFAYRAPSLEGDKFFAPVSREAGLLLNNLFLTIAALIVLFGTLYPLFLEGLTGDKISVGPPFFNMSFTPLTLILASSMALGPFLKWKKGDIFGVLSRVKFLIFMSFLMSLIVWYFNTSGPAYAVLGIGIVGWLFFMTLLEWSDRVKIFSGEYPQVFKRIIDQPRSASGMTLAHLGIALLLLGAIGSSAWKQELTSFAVEGTELQFAGFSITLEKVSDLKGPNYQSKIASLRVNEENGKFVEVLRPERRTYVVSGIQTTESDIRQSLFGDLYVSISEPSGKSQKGKWVLRLIYEPLVNFIWVGTILIVFGGLVSLSDKRFRLVVQRKNKDDANFVDASIKR
jgi:cytochrome c-type biogenesis protein CcmF